ncbi:MAG TPA: CopG family antitoxin [Oligoflexia bacterium]|nr:CopG family antitoxin [Oligoflexia bacterium]HMP48026.1 CopG family antitoxin [Oligoflexia bacterium]
MAKKQSESLERGKHQKKNAKHVQDSEIDHADIPELSDNQISKGRRVGRPKSTVVKQMIALRINLKLLSQIRKLAKKKGIPYQTLLHQLLEDAVDEAA